MVENGKKTNSFTHINYLSARRRRVSVRISDVLPEEKDDDAGRYLPGPKCVDEEPWPASDFRRNRTAKGRRGSSEPSLIMNGFGGFNRSRGPSDDR
ncbi:MAG: hypothetical protein OXE82_06695, partial [Rhodobacter sp.]|nr:hypothetical protein [Rhodobacter sp.]